MQRSLHVMPEPSPECGHTHPVWAVLLPSSYNLLSGTPHPMGPKVKLFSWLSGVRQLSIKAGGRARKSILQAGSSPYVNLTYSLFRHTADCIAARMPNIGQLATFHIDSSSQAACYDLSGVGKQLRHYEHQEHCNQTSNIQEGVDACKGSNSSGTWNASLCLLVGLACTKTTLALGVTGCA